MMNALIKWVAAGALAVATVPAVALARHASLPTEGAITVTPTSLDVPMRPQKVSAKKTTRKTARTHRNVSARRHVARRHVAGRRVAAHHVRHSARHKSVHKTARTHKKHAAARRVRSA